MGHPALRLIEPVPEPLSKVTGSGRLLELSGDSEGKPSACTTTAVSLLRHAQLQGETAAWIEPRGGTLYPPDLEHCGIDLDALVVVHIPLAKDSRGTSSPHRACKAAEILLRSGAFGLVVVDLCEGAPPPGTEAWQGRLLGLARQHHSLVVLLTEKPSHADSLGTLVGLRIEPHRHRERTGQFVVEHEVLKNKSGAPLSIGNDVRSGPWGLR